MSDDTLTAAAARRARARAVEAEQGDDGSPRRMANRRPFGDMEQTMAHAPIAGYRLYWFNDIPGRIDRAKAAGYEFVVDDQGEPKSLIVDKTDRGHPVKAYLMKIPEEWYQEDMAAQQAERDARMQAIKTGEHGPAGQREHQYVPGTGIKITTGERR